MDILAANPHCYALYASILTPQALPLSVARFLFLDPRAPEFFAEWDTVADDTVAALRTEAGRSPLDRNPPALSANSPPAATSSAPAGPGTTSGCTVRHPNASATPLWASCS